MTENDYQARLLSAQHTLKEFGQVLASKQEHAWGIPESRLPRSKDEIKDAIQLLILEIGNSEPEISKSLLEAYTILAQFIPDNKAELLAKGRVALESNDPQHEYWQYADAASKIVNDIKAEMERLMEEIKIFIKQGQPGKADS